MIRLANDGDFIDNMSVAGTITTTSTALLGPSPFTGQLKAIYGIVSTAGTGGNMTVDILQNGVSICSTGTIMTFASTSKTPTYNVANLLTNPIAVTKGDIFKLNVTAVNSTTAAVDLCVGINIERKRDGAQAAAMETGTYSSRSDIFN